MDSFVFRCAQDGLANLLGGYDGAGSWTVIATALRGPVEQQFVENHEGAHHELQATSIWGLIGAMAKLLAAHEFRPDQLSEAFDDMVVRSTRTHELFATSLPTVLIGLDQSRALLADNLQYTNYLNDALALVPVPNVSGQFQESAIAGVLRCVMAPLAVVDTLDAGFPSLRRGRIVERAHTPDMRLATFMAGDGPTGWRRLFDEIRADHPDLGGDLGGVDRRILPSSTQDMERLRRFEEEILLRRCYEHAAACLAAVGTPSVSWHEQAEVANKLIEAVRAVDTALADRLSLVTERRPILDDGLEYHRQRIELRNPLDCDVTNAIDTLRDTSAFQLGTDDDPYVCGVWLTGPVAHRQFGRPTAHRRLAVSGEEHVIALVAPAWRPDGTRVARLGMLPSDTTPGWLQRHMDLPVIAVTSHASLLDPTVLQLVSAEEPIFVVMDLPVVWHISSWVNAGARVRMAASPLEGMIVELWLAAFTIDVAPHLRFLCLGGKVSTAMVIEQVLRRHEDHITIDNRILGDGTEFAVRAILNVWQVLEQDSLA